MRRINVFAVTATACLPVLAATAALGGARVPGSAMASAGAEAPAPMTLRFKEGKERVHFVDAPPKAPKTGPGVPPRATPGDVVILRVELAGESGPGAGAARVKCTALGASRLIVTAPVHCVGSYVLRAGTLEFAATTRLSGPQRLAITGGTGAYVGARGSGVSSQTEDVLTFTTGL